MTQLIATVKQRTWKSNFPITKKEQTIKKSKRTVDSRTWKKRIYHDLKKNFNQSIRDGENNPLIYISFPKTVNDQPPTIYISSSKTVNDQPIYPSDYPPPHRSFGSDQKSVSTMLHSSLPFGTWNTKRWIATAVRSTVSHWTINPFFSPRIGWKSHQFWKRHQICLQNPSQLSHNFIEIATWDLESKTIHV